MDAMIQAETLNKTFKVYTRAAGLFGAARSLFSWKHRTVHAVRDLSLTIQEGELVGFIGPNGAGKSTTIKMLTGILHPSSGRLLVDGMNPHKSRKKLARRIGVVFGQRSQLWWDLPLIESFNVLRWIYSVPKERFDKNLSMLKSLLELDGFLHTPVRKLSLGQRVRGDITAAFLHEPKLLFLDEPTIGVDVSIRDKILEFIEVTNRTRRTTVVFTTHDLNTIEKLCERMIIIDHGRVIFDGSRSELKRLFGPSKRATIHFEAPAAGFDLGPGIQLLNRDGSILDIHFDPTKVTTQEMLVRMEGLGRIVDVSISGPTIEAIVKRLLRPEGAGGKAPELP